MGTIFLVSIKNANKKLMLHDDVMIAATIKAITVLVLLKFLCLIFVSFKSHDNKVPANMLVDLKASNTHSHFGTPQKH